MAWMNTKTKRRTGRLRLGEVRPDPLAFYLAILLVALILLALAQAILVDALPLSGVTNLSRAFNVALTIAQSWLLAGLVVCSLLLAWLKLRMLGAVLTLAALILWVLGMVRHLWDWSLAVYLLPVLLTPVIYAWGVRRASRRLVCASDGAERDRVLRFLRKYLWSPGLPGYLVGGVEYDEEPAVRLVPSTKKPQKSGPTLVITGPDRTVALSHKLRFKNVPDPGLIIVESRERITQRIDLRPQCRSFTITARTQDGIQVRVRASVTFQLNAGRQEPKLGEHLPFRRSAAFQALVRAQRVGHEEETPHGVTQHVWHDLPSIRAKHVLRDLVSNLDFDDLYRPHELEDRAPRQELGNALREQLGKILKSDGIQLIDLALGNFEPTNPRVYLKRARSWQTEWIRKMTVAEAEGQAERLQILERARADARTELILDLGRQLEDLSQSNTDLEADAVLEQFLEVLETLMARPQVKKALPQQTKDILSSARSAAGE